MLNPNRTLTELKQLRDLTSDQNGAQRVAWTPIWQKAREWFATKLDGLPVEHHLDPAGNNWVTLPGASDQVLIIGGHLDSVPNGGWLDGALGILTGLEILRRFATQYNGRPPVTIRIVDWADEEGARFGRSLLGSSAFAGTDSIAADRVRKDKDGITMEAALRTCGIEIDRFPQARAEQQNAAAYIELHIEQGPVLEDLGLPLGVVMGTKGVERHAITFHGQEAHSGSTPMNARHDALAAAAKLALYIRTIAGKHKDAVCTMGSVKTFPGIVTAVVGRCEVTLDQRDLNAAVLATMYAEAREASERFAREEKCTVEWARIWNIEPVPFHPDLLALCEQAVTETSRHSHRLPSGPLHDAAEVARAGIPAVMMFVQSLGGISHNKIEDTKEVHLEMSVIALDSLATKAVEWIQRKTK
ncbi:MAG: beta-ureidopropionase / N-carbamoyl-L-amino-acid hydrolase [Bryobacterales bacterium]|jgi:N-carbamoyl-L-amino-acid hydrolase|nr:beta-ureidopropionase / N-carbamoyl-L-amino-acid hydrolase [Bryobacterales bacterium]